jgi:carotenoid cleavage dioxygenase-like enzyme
MTNGVRRWPAAVLVAAMLGLSLMAAEGGRPHSDLPEDFSQIIPRGRIASVDDPKFVSASGATISDDAWVLGVVVDGEAHAYSLNLLNRHEIVNDVVAGRPLAAVW